MIGFPYREGGNIDGRAMSAAVHLDPDTDFPHILEKAAPEPVSKAVPVYPSMASRESSSTWLNVTP